MSRAGADRTQEAPRRGQFEERAHEQEAPATFIVRDRAWQRWSSAKSPGDQTLLVLKLVPFACRTGARNAQIAIRPPTAHNVIADDKNPANASLAVRNGRFFMRTDHCLYCIDSR